MLLFLYALSLLSNMFRQPLYALRISSLVQSCSLLNWKYSRFGCGCTPVTVNWFSLLFHHFLQYLRTFYIVWSLVRRRVTRELLSPGSKLCTPFLNISKHFKTVAVRLRLIVQFTYVQYCIHVHVHRVRKLTKMFIRDELG